MKKYTVSLLPKGKQLQLDSLPVAKITHYPHEKHAYKPYAQGALALDEHKLGLRLASFEVKPKSSSRIGIVLFPYPEQPEISLEIWGDSQGVTAWVNCDEKEKLSPEVHVNSGGDLQGIYWGYDIFISRNQLEKYGRLVEVADKTVKGNLFKVQTQSPQHFGAFDVAEFKENSSYKDEKMSDFILVSY